MSTQEIWLMGLAAAAGAYVLLLVFVALGIWDDRKKNQTRSDD